MSFADRGMRWLRKQSGNVAVSFLAAAAAAIFAALAVASWYSYSQWQLGLVVIGHRIDRLWSPNSSIRTDNALRSAETIPTAEAISLPADEYLMRVSGEGRLSETYRAQLQRDEYVEVELESGRSIALAFADSSAAV